MTIFNVYQSQENGDPKLLYTTENENEAKSKIIEFNLYFNSNNIESTVFYEGVDNYIK
jgi:hypothetical protein